MSDGAKTTTAEMAAELHACLFGGTLDQQMAKLEIKLIQKYLDEAFEAGRAHER